MSTNDKPASEWGPPGVRVVVRPLGTPLPVGFLGLLVASTVTSALQLGWVPATDGHAVALAILGFTVPLQLTSAVFGFLARDPVAGTGMGVLAGTWAAVGLVTVTAPPGSTSPALGVLLVTAACAMVVPTAAASTKLVAALVMGLSAVRFLVTGVATTSGSVSWKEAAGVTGLVLAALALYAALAMELEDARHRTVLPTLRRGARADVMTGRAEDELADLQHEAGVRKQL